MKSILKTLLKIILSAALSLIVVAGGLYLYFFVIYGGYYQSTLPIFKPVVGFAPFQNIDETIEVNLTMRPDETARQWFEVQNLSSQTVEAMILTDFDEVSEGYPPPLVRDWLTMPERVEIPPAGAPGSAHPVEYSFAVPADAPAGEHSFLISLDLDEATDARLMDWIEDQKDLRLPRALRKQDIISSLEIMFVRNQVFTVPSDLNMIRVTLTVAPPQTTQSAR